MALLIGRILYSQFRTPSEFVSGMLEADQIHVGSRLGGHVGQMLVKEGDTVVQATPLVEFEPFDLRERFQQAAAELAARESEWRKMQAGFRPEEIDQFEARYRQLVAPLSLTEEGPRKQEIAAARNRVVVAEAQSELAEREFVGLSILRQTQAISGDELDQATANQAAAKANLQVGREELEILEAGVREPEKSQTRAQVDETSQPTTPIAG
ncbi:MAG: hypothetical protein KF752_19655 [Pirellulaceae bacterium]|nr:hypothetical protein [Pirellulaceae bacterium]